MQWVIDLYDSECLFGARNVICRGDSMEVYYNRKEIEISIPAMISIFESYMVGNLYSLQFHAYTEKELENKESFLIMKTSRLSSSGKVTLLSNISLPFDIPNVDQISSFSQLYSGKDPYIFDIPFIEKEKKEDKKEKQVESSNVDSTPITIVSIADAFSENLTKFKNKNNFTINDLASLFRVCPHSVAAYLKGERKPRKKKYEEINTIMKDLSM